MEKYLKQMKNIEKNINKIEGDFLICKIICNNNCFSITTKKEKLLSKKTSLTNFLSEVEIQNDILYLFYNNLTRNNLQDLCSFILFN